MIVTDVDYEVYQWPRTVPIRNGLHTYQTSGLTVVKIRTDEGVTGIGLGRDIRDSPEVGIAILNHFKLHVIGEDPFDTEKIWRKMWEPKLVGRRGITTRVISGVDLALGDIKVKVANRSVHKLLGGYSDKVPVYVAGGYYEEGKFGIRIENLIFVKKIDKVNGKKLLGFENLTFVPIDTRLLDHTILTNPEKDWLNNYHREVF